MKIEIKCRFTSKVLFECEADSIKLAVEKAVSVRANLYGADLNGANLTCANLTCASLDSASLYSANLYGANLDGANLTCANLTCASLDSANLDGANLTCANLDSANLDSASLYSANLTRANLDSANLDSANLTRANLTRANLTRANLTRANLENTKKDFFEKLALAKNEVLGLYKAVVDGRIDGSVYHGECACFVGTIANLRGVDYESLADSINLIANSDSPTEKWFLAIRKGDTPEGNKISKITKEWLEEFLTANTIVVPSRAITWT